ncbi:hypothetical protein [Parasulfitobacter algicola]|uniref:Lipoprotein n=1 Tax=Parasulfitobacter algicola TaxID=2614809 RepID=A0ABX2INZ1_9RHOB|nr:hypothetical protein [Sulfitobacter algicola]NSX54616.1 hypothetical protein [Sulfitobacter algicola]
MIRILLLCFTLTACTSFPDLDDTVTERARTSDYPRILPLDQIVEQANDTQITPDTTADLEDRAERLRRRADQMRNQ